MSAEVKLWGRTIGAVTWDNERELGGIKLRRAKELINEVIASVALWPTYAGRAGVDKKMAGSVRATHRLSLNV